MTLVVGTAEPIVVLRDNAAPEPCEIAGCRLAQATSFALYRYAEQAWRNAGRYRCDEHLHKDERP